MRSGQMTFFMPLHSNCCPVSRIVDGDYMAICSDEVREVALLLQRRGNGGGVDVFVILLEPFLAIVTERLVLPVIEVGDAERAADRESVIVLVVGWRLVVDIGLVPGRSVEEADRVEHAVAVDVEEIAVIVVGSRLHLVCKSTQSKSELGSEGRPLNAKLLNHFERRIEVCGVAFGFRLRNWNAVVDDFLFKVDATTNAVGKGTPVVPGARN